MIGVLTNQRGTPYTGVRKVKWDQQWHALFEENGKEDYDRVDEDRAHLIARVLPLIPELVSCGVVEASGTLDELVNDVAISNARRINRRGPVEQLRFLVDWATSTDVREKKRLLSKWSDESSDGEGV